MSATWHAEVLVVIPSINGEALLRRMLPTLRFRPENVLVLDQGSTDGTDALCREAGVAMRQLGRPHSYTEACNIGAAMAREGGCRYVLICNNDITFRTDVVAELRAEMERDPKLGIVAPSQVIIDEESGERRFTSRVFWNLDRIEFLHDTGAVPRGVKRLEADFCELTCALVRLSAIAEVGFLDDEFGFYHEDADFGFRLRAAGYTSAYLPRSQIDHYSSSTFREMSDKKKEFIARNRRYFTTKHLGHGVCPSLPGSMAGGTWDRFGFELRDVLLRQGLVDAEAPELVMGPPGMDTAGYDYTDAWADSVPRRWGRYADRYRAMFTATAGMRDAFTCAGFPRCFHVPPGVETDVFQPWGPARRLFEGPVILVFADGWRTEWLRGVLEAWRGAVAGRNGWLVIVGHGLSGVTGTAPDRCYTAGTTEISRFEAERVELHNEAGPLPDAELAAFYRSVDYVLPDPADPALLLPLLRAQACGLPVIAGPGTALREVVPGGGLGYPDVSALRAVLDQVLGLSAADRRHLSDAAVYHVRGGFTLRHTTAGLLGALGRLQVRDPAVALARLSVREQVEAPAAEAPAVHVGSFAARKVKAAGRLVLTVGSAWEEHGLRGAGEAARAELGFFLNHRVRRAAQPAGGVPVVPAVPAAVVGAAPLAGSTLLVGYIDAQLGLGQSMRGLARAMDVAGCRFSILPVGLGVEGRRGPPFMPERYDTLAAHAVNVLEVAANELPRVRAHVGAYHFDRSYNILRPYWELGRAPEDWRPNLSGIAELWAPTRFVAESFRGLFPGPITVVPPCVDLPDWPRDGAAQFGLAPGRTRFLFSFDYYSFPQRKNPLGAIRAFRRAFPDPREGVELVVKSTGRAGHHPAVKQALRQAAEQDGRITIIDETLERDEMLALMAACDCYVSLHRSEGFGLGMAEAMAMGKAVIGTDYSGNTDFLSAETGFPVACSLRAVRPDEYVHTEGQVWAEPDIGDCARAMRLVVDDPALAEARAAAGQRFVRDRLGPSAVGALARRRLAEVMAQAVPAEGDGR